MKILNFAPGRPSSLYRQKFLFGPRCEVRPDFFIIFAPSSNSHIFIIVFPGLVERYGPDFHFKADFRPLKGEDGTTYHL